MGRIEATEFSWLNLEGPNRVQPFREVSKSSVDRGSSAISQRVLKVPEEQGLRQKLPRTQENPRYAPLANRVKTVGAYNTVQKTADVCRLHPSFKVI